jgi:hypothetical protein
MKKQNLVALVAGTTILASSLFFISNRSLPITSGQYTFTPPAQKFIDGFFQNQFQKQLTSDEFIKFAQRNDYDGNNQIGSSEAIK